MTEQSFYDKIKALGATDETTVKFSWEEGCDVFHYNETHVETALGETGAAYVLAEAITDQFSAFYGKGNSVLDEMREDGLLDEYERGDEAFTDFVAEVIGESFYDYDWIEQSTQRCDHKRGWTDLSMELSAPLGHIKEEFYNSNPLPSWTCQVRDGNGNLVTLGA
jgi:hypothetical protein